MSPDLPAFANDKRDFLIRKAGVLPVGTLHIKHGRVPAYTFIHMIFSREDVLSGTCRACEPTPVEAGDVNILVRDNTQGVLMFLAMRML